jgi:hypothetical protein
MEPSLSLVKERQMQIQALFLPVVVKATIVVVPPVVVVIWFAIVLILSVRKVTADKFLVGARAPQVSLILGLTWLDSI